MDSRAVARASAEGLVGKEATMTAFIINLFEQVAGGVLAIILLWQIAKRLDALAQSLRLLLALLKEGPKHG